MLAETVEIEILTLRIVVWKETMKIRRYVAVLVSFDKKEGPNSY